jgi:succinoglycan biosynthesis protein ExoO
MTLKSMLDCGWVGYRERATDMVGSVSERHMTNDTIAAVIPVYNKERYVAQAISSVLRQTCPVDEIIVVNDASTDDSLDQIRAFRDPRIRLLQRSEPGAGGYAARNLAIRHATARWIAFLDADDTWHKNFIEEIARLIAQASSRTGCVFTGYERVWTDGRAQRDDYSGRCEAERFTTMDFDTFVSTWLALRKCPIWTSASAFRRDTLLKAGLFPDQRCRRGGDKDLWLRAMAFGQALSSPRICATYNQDTANQVTHTVGTNRRHCLCATLEKMIEESSGIRRRLLMRLFNQEVFEYARLVGQQQRASPDIYRGFFFSVNPARYLVLLALSYLPIALQKLVRQAVLRGRRMARGRTRETTVRHD